MMNLEEPHHSNNSFVNPQQIFSPTSAASSHRLTTDAASSSKPVGLQRHLSLNLGDMRNDFDHPPSLSPMSLHDPAYNAGLSLGSPAYLNSPGIPQTANSGSSSATARPSRHRPRRSLSAGDLSQLLSASAEREPMPDFRRLHPLPPPLNMQSKQQSSNSSFIGKLWGMLHDDSANDTLISFSSSGSSFVISNATEFAKSVLPNHFKQ